MNRRTIAILIFVVGVLLLAVVGVIFVLQQDEPQPVETVPGEEGSEVVVEDGTPGAPPPDSVQTSEVIPPMVEVVVSLNTIPRGYEIDASAVITDMRLAKNVSGDMITDIDDAIGLYARTEIFQGETLTQGALVSDPTEIGRTEFGPSSLIPFGFIAQAVPLDRLSSVAYGLSEGDSIDILLSFYFYQIDEEFQTYLQNAAVFFLESTTTTEEGGEQITTQEMIVFPYGRFEEIPTGDTAHILPSEFQRPVLVSVILQNAKVIQVGDYVPREGAQPPTPTPSPTPEGAEEGGAAPPPSIPTRVPPPDVLLVALSPQQQLFLKYAVESGADIDYALRSVNDSQLYQVENVDVPFILRQFNIEVPPNFDYSVDTPFDATEVTPTPVPQQGEVPEGG